MSCALIRLTVRTSALAVLLGAAGCGGATQATQVSDATPTDLGVIDFPTSGSTEAQTHFLRTTAMLHSFGLEDAAQFERSLLRTPNRTLSLRGLARAAIASGDPETARVQYQKLVDQWRGADDAAILQEAGQFLSGS